MMEIISANGTESLLYYGGALAPALGEKNPIQFNRTRTATTTTAATTIAATSDDDDDSSFFDHQDDLVSEILGFLDVRSLLKVCSTTKKAAVCLRYDHVVSSTLGKKTSPTDDKKIRTADRNAIVVLNKLVQVYDLTKTTTTTRKNHSSGSGNGSKAAATVTATPVTAISSTKPSPLRLLRMVNGRKCERCHRDLASPCVWAGTSGFGRVVLPSLSFGAFCCTQCIFDPAPVKAKSKSE